MAYFIIFICRGFSSGSQAVNRGGGWLGNVHGNQHGMHKPPEQGGRSQGGENKSEDSFHTYSEIGRSHHRDSFGDFSLIVRLEPERDANLTT